MIPEEQHSPESNHLWEADGEVTPHPYYQQLLSWNTDKIAPAALSISRAISDGSLLVCADGSYFKVSQQGSHAWVFATQQRTVLWKGAGPALGHPSVMSPYRAELCGLTSVLFIILWVCNKHDIDSGSVRILCDSESALDQVFSTVRGSNNPLKQLASDFDLLSCAKDILLHLPVNITVTKEWVKGHYTGPNRTLQHDLNDLADKLAVDYNSAHRKESGHPPIVSPISEAELICDNSIITSRLPHLIKAARHTDALIDQILKQTGWSHSTFKRVDWEAHKQAFKKHSRVHRISISKLVHGLYQTKSKDNKYYGTPATCPCCQHHNETLNHVFTCTSSTTLQQRNVAITKLQSALEKIRTPTAIISSLVHGLQEWAVSQTEPDHPVLAPSRGSVTPAEILLTQAFTEQTVSLGWDQLLRGRISAKWRAAYRAYKVGGKQQETNCLHWATQVIVHVWDYAISLWKNRNEVVHGATRSENMQRQRDELCLQVTAAYEQFQDDPFIVSATHNSLFRRKTLKDRLKMGINSLSAWLQSVKEARAYQKVFQATLQKAAKKFFVPRSSLPQSSTRSVKTDNIRRFIASQHLPLMKLLPSQ